MDHLHLRLRTLFDGTEKLVENVDVKIAGGRIVAVGADLPVERDAAVIEAPFGMPGFIDAHTHLALAPVREGPGPHPTVPFIAARQAREKLASGVTTVRDVGGIDHIDIELRNAIRRGDVLGPRMLVAGRFVCPTGGHCHYFAHEADGPEEVRKAARTQMKAGSDIVKIMVSGGVSNVSEPPERLYMDDSEVRAAVHEAHEAGRRVAAHVHPAKGIKMCADAGVDTIEHGAWLDDEAIDAILAAGAAVIPTEAVYYRLAGGNDPHYAELAAVAQRVTKEKSARLSHAIERGIKIGVGTDCGRHYPYDDFVSELVYLQAAGMTPLQVLAAATSGNAAIIGLDDRIGTIAPGMAADMILMDGNPVDDLSAAGAVTTVIQGGRPMPVDAIRMRGAVI